MPRNFALTPEGQELAALCLDFGYKLEDCARDMTRNQINFILMAKKLRLDAVGRSTEEAEREAFLQSMKEG
ncbi:hypothetical protein [[Eubacterium] cellulosolvens]